MTLTFALLLAFSFKHFLADFPLQNEYMLGKFSRYDWVKPLAAHAGVHAAFTLFIALFVNWKLAPAVAILDFTVHFIMDRIKADPELLGRFKSLNGLDYQFTKDAIRQFKAYPEGSVEYLNYRAANQRMWGNKLFWWSLGFDQMIHRLTDYVVIFILVVYA